MGRSRDTSWHQPFLDLIAQGHSFTAAITELGSNSRTLYNHFADFPDFHATAMKLRRSSGRPMAGSPPADSPRPRIAALICAGLTVGQAAQVLGIPLGTMQKWVRRSPVKEQIDAGRTGPRFAQRRWPVNIDDLIELLRNIASGMHLADACTAAGIPVATVKRWRRIYDEVDAVIVAAAMDGRKRGIRPVSKLACPGPRCGTGTGYDYGCAEDACRTAAAERAYRRRHPDHPGEPNHG
ncbi:hypothetical protein [Streptosporangium sp. NPDC004631]